VLRIYVRELRLRHAIRPRSREAHKKQTRVRVTTQQNNLIRSNSFTKTLSISSIIKKHHLPIALRSSRLVSCCIVAWSSYRRGWSRREGSGEAVETALFNPAILTSSGTALRMRVSQGGFVYVSLGWCGSTLRGGDYLHACCLNSGEMVSWEEGGIGGGVGSGLWCGRVGAMGLWGWGWGGVVAR